MKATIVLKKTKTENQGTKVTYVAVAFVSKVLILGREMITGKSLEGLVKNINDFLEKKNILKEVVQLQTATTMTATMEETHLVFNESEFLSFKELFFKKN